MIKPASLWAMFKTCPPLTLGRVAASLGGQTVDPPLDDAEKALVSVVRMDSGWMDERMEEQRERWRTRQRKSRSSSNEDGIKGDVTQCHAMSRNVTVTKSDTTMSHDVTLHPSLPPSIHTLDTTNVVSACNARAEKPDDERPVYIPSPDEAIELGRQISIPKDYVVGFLESMRSRGWAYVNRSGATVTLNRRNFKAVLRSFFDHDQKKKESTHPSSKSTGSQGPGWSVVTHSDNYDMSGLPF